MPIYEYQCSACGHNLEAFQKMSEAPLTECPACHKASLQKLISSAGFQLKGTGWYVTDFRNKGKSDSTDTKTKSTSTSTPSSSESGKSKDDKSSSSSSTTGDSTK